MSEVTGKVLLIGQTETLGSAGTFRKRLIVVETNEQYSQKIPIDFVQDKCDILDKYNVGDEVKVSINIRGNEYNGKYYCSLNGWRIEKQATQQPAAIPHAATNLNEDEPDDLPF